MLSKLQESVPSTGKGWLSEMSQVHLSDAGNFMIIDPFQGSEFSKVIFVTMLPVVFTMAGLNVIAQADSCAG